MPSLRNKILRTYGFSKLVMLGFAVVVFVDLHYLNRQIEAGQVITDFREATLEMRRDEKNLFLYRDYASLDQLLMQIDATRQTLIDNRETFAAISGETMQRTIEDLVRRYRAELARYPLLSQSEQAAARGVIRDLGHDLSEASDELSRGERQLLAEATQRAALLLVLAFAGVVALGLAGGLFLVRRVVRPLRELEAGLHAIDEGRARVLPESAGDQEIQSFVTAFNAMLKHMRQQQDQARRNEKAAALGVLVSGVAHELNNPLSNISTSAQLLLEEDAAGDAEMKRLWLTQIDSETERARRIVRRLLDSVRQPKLHRQRLALADLVQSSLALVNRQLPAGVQVCVGTMAEIEIEVDRERLHQVFINLIKNAADAGARHVTVSAALQAWEAELAEGALLVGDPAMVVESPPAVRISVEDDGPGIPLELREHIFDPFITTRTSGEGTGLGLYLVEEIVGEHQGCIVLDAAVAGGTRFSIWLPGPKDKTP
ncbi:MAG: HAMP domain-containing sensor histidine kinase [Thiobacillus sp.]|uniref:sensor histidine kinase n=1 Tax=Thiobacillus sp. TaxID=924 RepID=UPI002735D33F|nr:HAMP domain-containing sensor histidine kinase [Thiobacillus sp.]MDP3585554.1 HAMP domain-containing sensor histidine kinase [Thiobacillus sp.]